MEKRLQYNFITTMMNAALGVVVLLLLFAECIMLRGVGKIFDISGETITGAGKHDLTGGYEVLGGLTIGFLGALGAMALVGIIIASVIVLMMLTATIIVGQVSRSNYKNSKTTNFTADSIVKIVIDGIIAVVCISSASIRQPLWMLMALIPTAVVVLCVISLCIKVE